MAKRSNARVLATAGTSAARVPAGRAHRPRKRTTTPPHDAIGTALQMIAQLADSVPGEALERYRELWLEHCTGQTQSAIEQHSEHGMVEAALDDAFEDLYASVNINKNLRSMVQIIQRDPFRWHEELSGVRLYTILGKSGLTRPFLEAFRGLERIAIRTRSSQSDATIEAEDDGDSQRGLTFHEAMELLAEAQHRRQSQFHRGTSKGADWQPVDCSYAEKMARERWDCVHVARARKTGARKSGPRQSSDCAVEDVDGNPDDATDITGGTLNDYSDDRGDVEQSGLSNSAGDDTTDGSGLENVTVSDTGDGGVVANENSSDTSPEQEVGRHAPPDLHDDGTDSEAFSFSGESPSQVTDSEVLSFVGASLSPGQLRSRFDKEGASHHSELRFSDASHGSSFHFYFPQPANSTHSNTGLDADDIVNSHPLPSPKMPMTRRKRAASPSPLQAGTGLTSRFKRTRLASHLDDAEQPQPSRRDYLDIAYHFLSRFASPHVDIVEHDAVLVRDDEHPCGLLLLATDSADTASAEDGAHITQLSDTSWSVIYFEFDPEQAPVLRIHHNPAEPIAADLQARVCAAISGKVDPEISTAFADLPVDVFSASCCALPELDQSERGAYESEYVDFIKCVAVMTFLFADEQPPPEALFLWAWLGAFAVCEQGHGRVSELSQAVELPVPKHQRASIAYNAGDYKDGCEMMAASAMRCKQEVEESKGHAEALSRFSEHLKRMRKCVEAVASNQSPAGADEVDKRIRALNNAMTQLPPDETTLLRGIEAKITQARQERAILARQHADSAALRELKAWIDWSVGEAAAKRDNIVAANFKLVNRIKLLLESSRKDLEALCSAS